MKILRPLTGLLAGTCLSLLCLRVAADAAPASAAVITPSYPNEAIDPPAAQFQALVTAQTLANQAADDGPPQLSLPEFPHRAVSALDLINDGKFSDAADAAAVLCESAPNSAVAHQIRGTIALWLGDTNLAVKDFAAAAVASPDEPATYYGLALCAASKGDRDTAAMDIDRARHCSSIDAGQIRDLSTFESYLQFMDNNTPPPPGPTAASDPALIELLAISAAHANRPAGVAALNRFLTTPSGVPRVCEDDGLRLTFLKHPALAPTVSDKSILAMYASRLAQAPPPPADADDAKRITGPIILSPDAMATHYTHVFYFIDDRLADVNTGAPYSFRWNTAEMLNGVHTVKIEERDDGGGTVGNQKYTFLVDNSDAEMIGIDRTSMAAGDYQDIETDLWNLLRPRPSRAVAELILSRFAAREGDRSDSDTHYLVASALDPLFAARQPTARRSPAPHDLSDIGVWYGPKTSRSVALTFDDGPNSSTHNLIDALGDAHIHATFFVIGTRVEVRPEDVRRMHAMGDEVENHSYTHPNISQCLPAMVESEILRTNIIIRSLTGRYPHYFRPPGGNASPTLASLSAAYGLRLAFWTVDALKAEETGSPSGLVDFVMKRVRPGAIILMHNGPSVTIKAIPGLVAALHARGYKIVTMNELLGN